MAKASDRAKEIIIRSLSDIYPDSAVIDKKLYINMNIEGEVVQIAVSLTAPKTKVEFESGSSSDSVSTATSKFTEEIIEDSMKEVEDIFDFFKL